MNWTPSQLKAIRSDSRDICVVAAAGSGKTGVLVERFAYWVLLGWDPDTIAAITYTRSAAEQLKEKITVRLAQTGRAVGVLPGVGTIHSFCARILKENAIDAGLDPGFLVLEGEALSVFEARAFEAWIAELDPVHAEGLTLILGDMRLADFERDLRLTYGRWRAMGRPAGPLPTVSSAEKEREVWAQLTELLRESRQMSAAADRSDFAALKTTPDPSASFEEKLEWLDELRSGAIAFKKTKAHAEIGKALIETAEAAANLWADRQSEPFTRAFAALLADFDGFYTRRKRAEALLDTDDLLEEALKLFTNDAFVLRFRSAFRGLLVDEYQDVNDLQSRLLERMSAGMSFFTVGDARQSIYRFRYAECRHLIDRARPANGREMIELSTNFRSRADTLGWINAVLSDLPFHDEQPFGELEAARTAGSGPAVELILERPSDKMTREESSRKQACRIADRIAGLAGEGMFRPGDMAVLFRRMKYANLLEEELRTRGIRFHSQRKRGFWDQIEVRDQLSLLRLLHNPEETFWAAAVLHSPWMALDEDALLRVIAPGKDWREALAQEPGGASERFLAWFDRLSRAAGSLPARRILAEALQVSGYAARTLAGPDGRARMANVKKFLELAAEAERLAGGGLLDFVRHAEALEEEDADRGEAALAGEKTDAVRILSVHSAKGLEFPVVFIWGLDQEITVPSRGRFFLTRKAQLVRKSESDPSLKIKATGAAFAAYRFDENVRDDLESRRLLYVALTRARERLVLCAALPPPTKSQKSADDRPPGGWLEIILGRLPDLRAAAPGPVGEGPLLSRLLDASVAPVRLTRPSGAALKGPVGCFEDRSRSYRQTLDLAVTTMIRPVEADPDAVPEALMWDTDAGLDENAWDETPAPSAPPLFEAPEFGQLLHETLQHVDLLIEPERAVDAVLARLRHRTDAPSVVRAGAEAMRFLTAPIGAELRRAAAAGRGVFRETPFLYRVRKGSEELGFLRGQLDLMFEGMDGQWTLVDYKTSSVHRSEYDDQTRLYAHALRNLLNGRPHRAVLFYTLTGESREVDLSGAGSEAFEADLAVRYEAIKRENLLEKGVEPLTP